MIQCSSVRFWNLVNLNLWVMTSINANLQNNGTWHSSSTTDWKTERVSVLVSSASVVVDYSGSRYDSDSDQQQTDAKCYSDDQPNYTHTHHHHHQQQQQQHREWSIIRCRIAAVRVSELLSCDIVQAIRRSTLMKTWHRPIRQKFVTKLHTE